MLLGNLGKEFQRGGDTFINVFAAEPIPAVKRFFEECGMQWSLIPGWSEGDGREHPWHFCREAVRLIVREKPDLVAVSFGNELPVSSCAASLRSPGRHGADGCGSSSSRSGIRDG